LTSYKTLRLAKNLKAVESHETAVRADDTRALDSLDVAAVRIKVECSFVKTDQKNAASACVPFGAVAHRTLPLDATRLETVVHLLPVHSPTIPKSYLLSRDSRQ
jgi:hypothetical protein